MLAVDTIKHTFPQSIKLGLPGAQKDFDMSGLSAGFGVDCFQRLYLVFEKRVAILNFRLQGIQIPDITKLGHNWVRDLKRRGSF